MTDTLDLNQSLHGTYAHTPTTPTKELMNVITVWGNSDMGGRVERPGGTVYLPGGMVSDTAMATVLVEAPDELYVEKTANTDMATVGETVTYTIKVGVTEGVKQVNEVFVIDEKIGLSERRASINNGEMVSYPMAYEVQENDYPRLTNTVIVTGMQGGGVVTATDRYTIAVMKVLAGALELNKTGPESVKSGDIITYEYTITNSDHWRGG